MYIYIYTYMYTYISRHMCIYIYIYIHTLIYIYGSPIESARCKTSFFGNRPQKSKPKTQYLCFSGFSFHSCFLFFLIVASVAFLLLLPLSALTTQLRDSSYSYYAWRRRQINFQFVFFERISLRNNDFLRL